MSVIVACIPFLVAYPLAISFVTYSLVSKLARQNRRLDELGRTDALTRSFGAIRAVDALTIDVPRGIVFGFLGPNGSGKTTTIRLLLGLIRPDAGSARVLGLDPVAEGTALRARCGALLEFPGLYERMSAEDNLEFTARIARLPASERHARIRELLDRVGLWERRKELAGNWSRGMKQKLAVARALLPRPELVFLDEPTAGLDPAMTEEVLQALVSHVASKEMTVFFSSHQIAEVDQIADHVAIIDRGRAVVMGPLDDLRERFRRIQLVFDGDAPEPAFRSPGVVRVRRKGRVLTVLSSAGAERILEEARALNAVSVDVVPVTLKEIFLETVTAED